MNPSKFAATVVLGLSFASPALAHEYIIDQRNEPMVMTYRNIRVLSTMGQEFVPAAPRLNVVEVDVFDATTGYGSASLLVRIRRDAPDGEILGVSDTVTMPPRQDGGMHFDFPTPVVTTVGVRHVIEIVWLSGGQAMLGSGGSWEGVYYDGGRQYWSGYFHGTSEDIWFRTGYGDAPVPVRPQSWGDLKTRYR